MDKNRQFEDDTDALEGYNGDFDDPSLDVFSSNCIRSDEKELKVKTMRKQEKRIMR